MFSKCAFLVSGGRIKKCHWMKNLLPMIQERPIHCYIGHIPLQFKFNCYWIIIRHPVYNLALWSTNLNSPVSYQSDSKFSKAFLFRGHPYISWRPEGGGSGPRVSWQSRNLMVEPYYACFRPVIPLFRPTNCHFYQKHGIFSQRWHTCVYFWQIVVDISQSIHLCAALVQFSSPWVLK